MFGPEAFNGVAAAIIVLFLTAIISLPFAIWKIVELIIWLVNNVSITVGG